jgi:aspartyl-tRNA(Asn)/glutamyl-tRNA(Gln) amidotransferase subunit A
MTDLTDLTIAEAGVEMQARRLSPTELTDAYLRRIERHNPLINAYITVTAERATADARRATDELAAGRSRGPLHGIPVGLKDLVDTAGIRTTAGSIILDENVPAADATLARKLAEAGTVLLGKLNTHEFAWGVTTNNPHYGPTRNPWDTSRIPGGSSGGSGAAIAAALACGTIGTDTGGSIRIPAALCGCAGLKPTFGRVSKAGVAPMSFLYDHPGPITKTVEDAALMLQVLAGYDSADPHSARVPVDDYTSGLRDGVRGLRIGVVRNVFFELLDPEVGAAVETAIGVLKSLGAEVRDITVPVDRELLSRAFAIVVAESQELHEPWFSKRPGDYGADLQRILSQPVGDAKAAAASLRAGDQVRAAFRTALDDVDLLLTPTCPLGAAPIGEETSKIGGVELAVGNAFSMLTSPFNTARLPVLSVPCGFTSTGLPIGLSLAGRPFDEALVLRAGHAYEQATDWHKRRPAFT